MLTSPPGQLVEPREIHRKTGAKPERVADRVEQPWLERDEAGSLAPAPCASADARRFARHRPHGDGSIGPAAPRRQHSRGKKCRHIPAQTARGRACRVATEPTVRTAGTSACPSASIEPPPAAFAPPCMMPELVAVGSSTRARTRVCDDSSRWGRAQHGDRPRAHNRRDEEASPEGSSGLQNLVAE